MKKKMLKLSAILVAGLMILASSCKDDTVPPVITLTGESEVFLNLGDTWQDPGATAEDDNDGNLTSQITTTGTVNTNKVGEYTITYTVSDEAGNTATATRKVYVKADRLAGTYQVNGSITGPGQGNYQWTENVQASSVDYNKLIFSNFSGFANLNVNGIVSGDNISLNQTVTYDWDDDGTPTQATISTTSSSYEVTGPSAGQCKIKTINYSINYGSAGTDVVAATYTKQ
ncbi:MAG: DUF5011 domain-containing protein [Bacteroidales bacterium]|nr:DUF5011 domain-containing protein [Bacteroidales bacterium]